MESQTGTQLGNTPSTTTATAAPPTTTPAVVESTSTGEPAKLSVGQKKRLKEKAKKEAARLAKENEAATPVADVKEDEESKHQRKMDWALYQLELGQQRKGATRDQLEESRQVVRKLLSPKSTLVQKEHLMHVVFGGKIEKYMKEMPIPKEYLAKKQKEKDALAAVTAATAAASISPSTSSTPSSTTSADGTTTTTGTVSDEPTVESN
ncbi:hypothetical protein DFA_02525 [Cavenderia fasciculata]|uniref:Uncharacterized protein n=1 Tax=Cavenderia fasciculata TaxID=261658 RepID=F4PZM2_CACFS|nr:uncharacterized protein DFA_02525 [Cavenderia fasciculata]EGG18786.1 hypothetical protein DFA_02525 [Cavenderia fasciculata]|eukprot:XP_004357248.1 hypothetical protein DFA_02525 [Cavenderia fasciculata]